MATFVKAAVGAKAHGLPGRYYTSPDIFKHERDRVFAQRWICVGREEQLPEAGSFFLADVAGESLIIVREATGSVHSHFNVCRHRGSRICEDASGRFKGSMMCPYHAWTYALDGKLIAARNMRDVPDFHEGDYPLRHAHVHVWCGFIFVNLRLTEEREPFEVELQGLLNRFDRWNIGSLREARRI